MEKRKGKIDGKSILMKLKSNDDRAKVSLYLSQNLYETFKEVCKKEKVPASRVMEELMNEFINSVRERKE